MRDSNNRRLRRVPLRNPKAKEGSLAFLPSSPPSHQETFQFPQFHNKVKKKRKNPEAGRANEGLLGIIWFNPRNNPAITSPLWQDR